MSSFLLTPFSVFHCFWPHTSFIFWPGLSPPLSPLIPIPAHWSLSVSYLPCSLSVQGLPTMLLFPRPLFLLHFYFLVVVIGTRVISLVKARVSSHGSHHLCPFVGIWASEGFVPAQPYITPADCSISDSLTWLKSPQGQGLHLFLQIMHIRPSILEVLNQNDVFYGLVQRKEDVKWLFGYLLSKNNMIDIK